MSAEQSLNSPGPEFDQDVANILDAEHEDAGTAKDKQQAQTKSFAPSAVVVEVQADGRAVIKSQASKGGEKVAKVVSSKDLPEYSINCKKGVDFVFIEAGSNRKLGERDNVKSFVVKKQFVEGGATELVLIEPALPVDDKASALHDTGEWKRTGDTVIEKKNSPAAQDPVDGDSASAAEAALQARFSGNPGHLASLESARKLREKYLKGKGKAE